MRFHLPVGYASRDTPEYFNDVEARSSGRIWQPEVYELAEIMLHNRGCDTVLDIGCGSGLKLEKLNAHRRIGVDFGSNINWCRQNYSWGIWIERDLEADNVDYLQEYLGPSTVVICSDVVEHLWNPLPLVSLWRAALDAGAILITSTPDRILNRGLDHNGPPLNPAHVREWSLEEYIAFLCDQGVPVSAAGWTINNDVDRALTTIVSFHDGGVLSKERGRPGCATIRFEALRPWLTGLKLMGGVLGAISENRIMDEKADIGEVNPTHPSGDRTVNGDIDAGFLHAQSSQRRGMDYNSILERMILLATEVTSARAKVELQERALVEVGEAQAADAKVIKDLHDEIASVRASLADAQKTAGDTRSIIEELSNKELQLTKERVRLAGLEAENCILRDNVGRMSSELDEVPKRALAVYYGIRRRIPMQVLRASADIFDRFKPKTAK